MLDVSIGFSEADRGRVVELLRAYEAWVGIPDCFQGFADEIAGLPGAYGPPAGAFAVARRDGLIVGIAGLRALDPAEKIAEMKRLYLAPEARGLGAGRKLTTVVLEEARRLGYRRVRLDTLPTMAGAQSIYRQLGFREIAPYNDNPVPGVLFFEVDLQSAAP